jgi:hypothetical protein
MQAADPREADDVGCRVGTLLDRTPERRVLAYPEMRSVCVVVGDRGTDQLPQVALVQDDDVVEKFPAEKMASR